MVTMRTMLKMMTMTGDIRRSEAQTWLMKMVKLVTTTASSYRLLRGGRSLQRPTDTYRGRGTRAAAPCGPRPNPETSSIRRGISLQMNCSSNTQILRGTLILLCIMVWWALILKFYKGFQVQEWPFENLHSVYWMKFILIIIIIINKNLLLNIREYCET